MESGNYCILERTSHSSNLKVLNRMHSREYLFQLFDARVSSKEPKVKFESAKFLHWMDERNESSCMTIRHPI